MTVFRVGYNIYTYISYYYAEKKRLVRKGGKLAVSEPRACTNCELLIVPGERSSGARGTAFARALITVRVASFVLPVTADALAKIYTHTRTHTFTQCRFAVQRPEKLLLMPSSPAAATGRIIILYVCVCVCVRIIRELFGNTIGKYIIGNVFTPLFLCAVNDFRSNGREMRIYHYIILCDGRRLCRFRLYRIIICMGMV